MKSCRRRCSGLGWIPLFFLRIKILNLFLLPIDTQREGERERGWERSRAVIISWNLGKQRSSAAALGTVILRTIRSLIFFSLYCESRSICGPGVKSSTFSRRWAISPIPIRYCGPRSGCGQRHVWHQHCHWHWHCPSHQRRLECNTCARWLCNKVAGIEGMAKGGAKRGRGARHCKLLQWPQLRRNSLRFSFRLFMFLSLCGFYERRCQLISSPLTRTLLALPQRSQFVKQLMPDGATVHRRHRVNKTITDFL